MTTSFKNDRPAAGLANLNPDALAEAFGLDGVLVVEPGRKAVGLRNVPGTLPLLATHFPRFPVLPGVLILDDLAMVAALALEPSVDHGPRWRLGRAVRARYRHFVRPGDRAEIAVERLDRADAEAVFRGTVEVDGQKVTTVAELHMLTAGETR